ncbi:MFS transporter [Pleurostoma richardsiae]|uniref:MFS transporter n=1 Tax=Pleurostoma richardsiae TaxID=41990 RepID=A0AA38VDW3_9PEZI|nr:MFS transporter [Pleurostoma richardsiae]
MGIKQDANLNASQYSWVGSVYYVGYLVADFPHNRALQYFDPSKYIAVCVALWGICLASMAAAHNFQGLMAARTFLGAGEAVVSCGFLLITASWYRKYEHASRVGIWSCFIGVSNIIGGLIAYGCVAGLEKHPNASFTSWRTLVLCTGIASSVFGICMFFFFASTPLKAKWLSEGEKVIAIERLRMNHQGMGSQQFKWSQFRETFTDIRTWLGFSSKETLLFAMPSGAVQVISDLAAGYIADRTKQRTLTAAGIRTISLLLLKTTTNGLAFTAMAVAYLVGPQIFQDGPYYPKAKSACVGLWAAAVVILLVLYAINAWENKRRDADPANFRDSGEHADNIEFMDLTDKENKVFRYVLQKLDLQSLDDRRTHMAK